MYNKAAGGGGYPFSESCGRGRMFMSTYEEFMIILTSVLVVVAILDYVNHKK